MPRIVAYIKEMLDEDKYGSAYTEKLPIRLKELNAAQLTGMYAHLSKIQKTSVLKLWGNANLDIMTRMEAELNAKRAVVEAKQKKRYDELLKLRQARATEKAKKAEGERVVQSILEQSREKAIQQVHDEEYKRKSDERIELIKLIIKGEARQKVLIIRGTVFFVVSVVVVSVSTKIYYIIAPVILFSVIITGFVYYWAYLATKIEPLVVTEEEIQHKIEVRAEDLRLKAINALKQKENEFNARVLRENQERRAIRKARRDAREAEIVANRAEFLSRKSQRLAAASAKLGSGDASISDGTSVESQQIEENSSLVSIDGTTQASASTHIVRFAEQSNETTSQPKASEPTSPIPRKSKAAAAAELKLEKLKARVVSVSVTIEEIKFFSMEFMHALKLNLFGFIGLIEHRALQLRYVTDVVYFDDFGADKNKDRDHIDEVQFQDLTEFTDNGHHEQQAVSLLNEDFLQPIVDKFEKMLTMRRNALGDDAVESKPNSNLRQLSSKLASMSWKAGHSVLAATSAQSMPETSVITKSETILNVSEKKTPSPIFVDNQEKVEPGVPQTAEVVAVAPDGVPMVALPEQKGDIDDPDEDADEENQLSRFGMAGNIDLLKTNSMSIPRNERHAEPPKPSLLQQYFPWASNIVKIIASSSSRIVPVNGEVHEKPEIPKRDILSSKSSRSDPSNKSWEGSSKRGFRPFAPKPIIVRPSQSSKYAQVQQHSHIKAVVARHQDHTRHTEGKRWAVGVLCGGSMCNSAVLAAGDKLKLSLYAIYKDLHPPHRAVHSVVNDVSIDINDILSGCYDRVALKVSHVIKEVRCVNMCYSGEVKFTLRLSDLVLLPEPDEAVAEAPIHPLGIAPNDEIVDYVGDKRSHMRVSQFTMFDFQSLHIILPTASPDEMNLYSLTLFSTVKCGEHGTELTSREVTLPISRLDRLEQNLLRMDSIAFIFSEMDESLSLNSNELVFSIFYRVENMSPRHAIAHAKAASESDNQDHPDCHLLGTFVCCGVDFPRAEHLRHENKHSTEVPSPLQRVLTSNMDPSRAEYVAADSKGITRENVAAEAISNNEIVPETSLPPVPPLTSESSITSITSSTIQERILLSLRGVLIGPDASPVSRVRVDYEVLLDDDELSFDEGNE